MTHAQRRARAYEKLGIQPNDVACSVRVTPRLRMIKGCRDQAGNPMDPIAFAIECLRTSDAPDARKFLAIYDDITLPRYVRDELPLEAFIVASGVQPERFFGIVMETAFRNSVQLGQVIASIHHPQIVEMSSQLAAAVPEATEDRLWHFKNMGFLPTPKGQQTSINVNVAASAQAASVAAPALTSPEERVLRLSDRFNDRRAIEANEAPALPAARETLADTIMSQHGTLEPEAEYVDADDSDED